ncbi:MAG TPA: 8-oxo-dGTP diphosphatase MutT [Alphaproteobacteria bacterium]|nr:8-oxo-dGTP diphosphatase MutT [Alphaproteobacteria bacterium]
MACIDVTLPPLAPNRPLLLVAAAALIDADHRVLLAQRPEGKVMAGLWEFPGGKVHEGETPEHALVRELREELGIETSTGCMLPMAFASHAYEKFHLLMPVYGVRVWHGTPEGKEGQKLAWVAKNDLKDYEMPPADVALVQTLWELL